jgi:hypothetical protein
VGRSRLTIHIHCIIIIQCPQLKEYSTFSLRYLELVQALSQAWFIVGGLGDLYTFPWPRVTVMCCTSHAGSVATQY